MVYSQVKTDLEIDGLKGKVKSETRIVYRLESDGSKTIQEKRVTRYNQKGFKTFTSKDSYPAQKIYDEKVVYVYDKLGNNTEIRSFSPDSILESTKVLEYDTQNHLLKESNYSTHGTLIGRKSYKYDEKGRQIESITWGRSELDFIAKEIKTYDNNGNLLSVAFCKSNNVVSIKKSYKYDQSNNEIEYTESSSLGNSDKTQKKYDSKNQMIEFLRLENDKVKQKVSFVYDDKGNVVEIIYSYIRPKETETIVEKKKYNDKNDLIEVTNIKNGNSRIVRKEEIEYDSHDNHIKRIVRLTEGSPVSFTKTFEYYN